MKRCCQITIFMVVFFGFSALIVYMCYKSTKPPTEAECTTSALKLNRCNAKCYKRDVCAQFLEAAREAAGLRESFKIELRHHLQLLKEAQTNSSEPTSRFCRISESDWHLKSRQLKSAIKGTRGCTTCNLKLPSDSATCAALVKQLECAVSRIVVTYGSRHVCLNSTSFGACRSTIEFIIRESAELDVMYGTALSERKAVWDDIKLRLQGLNRTMGSLRGSYGCPKGTVCGSQKSISVKLEIDYVNDVESNTDDSWSEDDDIVEKAQQAG